MQQVRQPALMDIIPTTRTPALLMGITVRPGSTAESLSERAPGIAADGMAAGETGTEMAIVAGMDTAADMAMGAQRTGGSAEVKAIAAVTVVAAL